MLNKKSQKDQLDQKRKTAWNKCYAKDLPIIGKFLKQCKVDTNYRLYFNDGTQIIASYETCGDSDNDLELDDPYYEEFYEFYFIVKKIEKKGAELDFKENVGIALNYHNYFEKFELYEGTT